MKKPNSKSLQVRHIEEAVELYGKLIDEKNPKSADVERLRGMIVSTPAIHFLATETMASIRNGLIEKMSSGAARACISAEVAILAEQLGYATSSPLERLLIDHILMVRLRLIHAENCYNSVVVNQSVSFETAEYRDNLLSSTQARFLRAIETLARVRRLARNVPSLQINIAGEGAKQVNMQGDLPSPKSPPL